MKRILAVLVTVSVLACMAVAQDVTSVNAVGFIKKTIPDGGWGIIAMPLASTTGAVEFAIGDILVDAPDYTQVSWFDVGLQTWLSADNYGTGLGWYPNDVRFIRGDAMLVQSPPGSGPVTFTITGEVPSTHTAGTSTVVVASGFSLLGFSYPVDVLLTNSAIAGPPANDYDAIYWLEADGSTWSAADNYGPGVGWFPSDVVLKAGEGYLYFNNATQFDWTEVKNNYYSWP